MKKETETASVVTYNSHVTATSSMVEPRLSKAAYFTNNQDGEHQSMASYGTQGQSSKFKLQKQKQQATSNYDSSRRSRSLAGGPLSIASSQNAGAGPSQAASSSVIRNDYNGKKSKILHTLKQIDDSRMGVVKSAVFQNLLNCLDVELTNSDMVQLQSRFGIIFEGVHYVRYEAILRELHFDNHADRWMFNFPKNDQLSSKDQDNISETATILSTKVRRLQERSQGQKNRYPVQDNSDAKSMATTAAAASGVSQKRESLGLALRSNNSLRHQILSQHALATFNTQKSSRQSIPQEPLQQKSQNQHRNKLSQRKSTLDQSVLSGRSRSIAQQNDQQSKSGVQRARSGTFDHQQQQSSTRKPSQTARSQAGQSNLISKMENNSMMQQQQQQPLNQQNLLANKSLSEQKQRNPRQNQLVRSQMLKRLLTADNDKEKQLVANITNCIKFMHQNYDIEWFRVSRVYQAILQEFKSKSKIAQVNCEPTHVPEDVFLTIASSNLDLPQLSSTRLYEKLKECLIDPDSDEHDNTDAQMPLMFSVQSLKRLVDLYQFLPSKKGANQAETAFSFSQPKNSRNYGTSQVASASVQLQSSKKAGNTPLELLQKQVKDLQSNRQAQIDKFHAINPNMTQEAKQELREKMSALAHCLIANFGQVSTAFRAFDIQTRGSIHFSDFAFVVDQLKLPGFNRRETIIQIFTYLDTDRDNILRYRDFCNLCAEAMPTVVKSDTMSQSDFIASRKGSTNSDFSKMIIKLKSKKINERRGGPNFIKRDKYSQDRRLESANGAGSMAHSEVIPMSPELHRFMSNMRDIPAGHSMFSPQHSTYEAMRDDQIAHDQLQGRTLINNITYSPKQTSQTRSGVTAVTVTTTGKSGTPKSSTFRNRLQSQTHGLTSQQISQVVDRRAKANNGQIGGIINYDYERDYQLEALMQENMLKAKKVKKKSADMRRTTKAHQGALVATKKRIKNLNQNGLGKQDQLTQIRSTHNGSTKAKTEVARGGGGGSRPRSRQPSHVLSAGTVPQFHPEQLSRGQSAAGEEIEQLVDKVLQERHQLLEFKQ